MNPIPVIAIFDIGKTNKKILLFDRQYKCVYEEETTLTETADEDGFPCEDIAILTKWVRDTFEKLNTDPAWDIRGLNFSTYGASFVHVDHEGNPLTPLYNYLKPIDASTISSFYKQFGLPEFFSYQTGSPVLHMLNSGIQLYWIKEKQPAVAKAIDRSLHLPQYLSMLFTGEKLADITSIGCHTGLWDVHKQQYHEWLDWQGVREWLPQPLHFTECRTVRINGKDVITGIGLHDSSASLLPFLTNENNDTGILSTGTWNILMLPAFTATLKEEDYAKDCLFYLLGANAPVAAARVFLGNEFDHQLAALNKWFDKELSYYKTIQLNRPLLESIIQTSTYSLHFIPETMHGSGPLPDMKGTTAKLDSFDDFETAYHRLVADMAWLQKQSADILLAKSSVKKLYVTGGFARNEVFMCALSLFMPQIQWVTASVAQGTALGAALALHEKWNKDAPVPVI